MFDILSTKNLFIIIYIYHEITMSQKLQKELAIFITISLKKAQIQKNELAKSINTSTVFVTKITRSPGGLPSPSRIRDIINFFLSNKINIEREVEDIIQEFAEANYLAEYYFAKLKECYKDVYDFVDYLKTSSKVNFIST